MTVIKTRLLLVCTVFMLIALSGSNSMSQGVPSKHGRTICLVLDQSNTPTTMAWRPEATLRDILLSSPQDDVRLTVHLWRKDKR